MVIVSGFALLSGAAHAQSTANSDAGAEILAPIVVVNTQDLFFGQIIPNIDNPGNVVLTSAGTRTCDAALTCVGNSERPATFDVRGIPDASYTIALPSSITIDDIDPSTGVNGAGVAMTVDSFSGPGAVRTLSNLGADDFAVGATLGVGTNQEPGLYTGNFDVTVDYQ